MINPKNMSQKQSSGFADAHQARMRRSIQDELDFFEKFVSSKSQDSDDETELVSSASDC